MTGITFASEAERTVALINDIQQAGTHVLLEVFNINMSSILNLTVFQNVETIAYYALVNPDLKDKVTK